MEKFWLVVSNNNGFCAKYTTYKQAICAKYTTYKQAKEGAEGMARLAGESLVVLEAMEVVTPKQIPVEWEKL
jgi:hypothetical protein